MRALLDAVFGVDDDPAWEWVADGSTKTGIYWRKKKAEKYIVTDQDKEIYLDFENA